MPPQGVPPGGGVGSAVQQPPSQEVHKEESKGTSKIDKASSASNASTSGTPLSSKKEPEDSKATARAAQGSKQNAIEQKSQNNVHAQIVQKKLQNQIPAATTGTAYTAPHFAADAAKASAKTGGGVKGDFDKDHVSRAEGNIGGFITAADQSNKYDQTRDKNQAIDSLAIPRELKKDGTVPVADRPYWNGQEMVNREPALKEMAAGFTKEEFNGILNDFAKDKGKLDAVVQRSLENPALLDRIAKEADPKMKETIAVKILGNNTTHEKKFEAIQKFTSDPKFKFEQFTKSNPALIAREASLNPNMAEMVAKKTPVDTQLSVAQSIMRDSGVTAQQRTDGLRGIFSNTNKEGLNHLIKKSTPAEARALATVIGGSTKLQERAARELNGPELDKIFDATLRSPEMNSAQVGKSAHVMMANLKPDAKNKVIDYLQKEDLMPDLLQSQTYMPIQNGLLRGLNAENAAAVAEGYWLMGTEARDNPQVANPGLLGRSSTVSRTEGYSNSSSKSEGTEKTVGGSVGYSKGPLQVTVSGSSANSNSTTVGSESRNENSYSDTTEKDAVMKYESDMQNWQARNSYWRKMKHVDNWAQDISADYSNRYKKMKDQLHRDQ